MHKETFYLDGVDALSVGIRLQKPIEFSEPVPIVEKESIPGRNGDLVFDTGAFENRTATASCFALSHNNVGSILCPANKFLLSNRSYRKLETSDDPEHYWMARVENGTRIEQRLRTLAPFEISFDCKPQKFCKDGLGEIAMSSGGIVYNQYGFETKPLIIVYGTGSGLLNIGDTTVSILSMSGVLYLDSETHNAYNDSGNQNQYINAPEFPVLKDGGNAISWTGGVNQIKIIPRWWEL